MSSVVALTSKKQQKKVKAHVCAQQGKRELGLSQEHLDLEEAVLWFCSYHAAARSQEKQRALTCYIHLVN